MIARVGTFRVVRRGYDWYVNPADGNDANGGRSPAAALKTVAAAAMKSGKIGFWNGSNWERLAVPASGLTAWYRSDLLSGSIGSAISSWADSSGKGNTLTASGSSRPAIQADVAGLRAASFRGSQAMDLPGGFTITKRNFTAVMFLGRSANARLGILGFGSLELNMQLCVDGKNTVTCYYAEGTMDSNIRCLQRGWMGIVVRPTGPTLGCFSPTGQQFVAAGVANTSPVGGVVGSANGYWPMIAAVNEVMFYDHGLSDTEITTVGDYFRKRYSMASSYAYNVVCDGDSITQGYQSTDGFTYPNQLGLASNVCVYNEGVPSKTLLQMRDTAAANIDPVYDATKTRDVLVIWGGTNDFYMSDDTVDNVYGYLQTYCAARRAVGWKVVVATMLPRSGPQTVEAKRNDYNSRIRAGWQSFADALADVAAEARLSNNADGAYFSDGTHLTNLGYGVAAGIIKTAIQALL